MRFLGGFLIIVGLLSIALQYLDMQLVFLKWIYQWGQNIAWMIRGGILLAGLILYIAGKPIYKG